MAMEMAREEGMAMATFRKEEIVAVAMARVDETLARQKLCSAIARAQ